MGSWWSSEVAVGVLLVVGVTLVVLLETALERRFGEGSRAQSIFAALVIAGIVGFFGWRYMRDAEDAGGLYVGTPVRRWVTEGGEAILYKKTSTRVRGEGQSGTSDDTTYIWELELRRAGQEPRRVELDRQRGGALDGGSLTLRQAGPSHLWVLGGAPKRLSLVTGEVEAAGLSGRLEPPLTLHPRQPRQDALAVQDGQARWWWVKGDLSVEQTTDEGIEGAYIDQRDAERLGCETKREYELVGSGERKRLKVAGGKVKHHGKVEPEGESPLLKPTFVKEAERGCVVEVGGWPLVVVRTSLAADAGAEVVGARAGAEAPAWRQPLDGRCGGASPRGVYQGSEGAVVVGTRGAVCGLGAQGLVWARGPGELFELGEVKGAGVFDVARRGEALEVWAASPSGQQLYSAVIGMKAGEVSERAKH